MIVYRIEDKEGWGAFSGSENWPEAARTSDNNLHSHNGCTVPIPIFEPRTDYRFGCKNITDLKRYWGDGFKSFEEDENWVIAKYRVRKNYVIMGTQGFELAFKIEKAERI